MKWKLLFIGLAVACAWMATVGAPTAQAASCYNVSIPAPHRTISGNIATGAVKMTCSVNWFSWNTLMRSPVDDINFTAASCGGPVCQTKHPHIGRAACGSVHQFFCARRAVEESGDIYDPSAVGCAFWRNRVSVRDINDHIIVQYLGPEATICPS